MSGRPYVVLVHPRGTYKSTPFYFRGDDVLKEPEYLQKEKQDLEQQLKKVTKELEKEKKIYDEANEELKKRDDFTVTLASALGSESEATTENADLRHTLAELTTKIEGTERAITKFKAQQQQPVITSYQMEKAYYETEMEDLRIKIMDGVDEIKDDKEALAKAVCSDEFATANIASGLLNAKQMYHGFLRKELTKKINDINKVTGEGILKGTNPKLPIELTALIERKHKLLVQSAALKRETRRKILTGRETALAMVKQLDRMNEILVALGGDRIDTKPLKEKYEKMDFTKPCDAYERSQSASLEQHTYENSEETTSEEQPHNFSTSNSQEKIAERTTSPEKKDKRKREKMQNRSSTSSNIQSRSRSRDNLKPNKSNESLEQNRNDSKEDIKKDSPEKPPTRNPSKERMQSRNPSQEYIKTDSISHETIESEKGNNNESEQFSDFKYEKPKEEEDTFDKEHENTDLIIKDFDQAKSDSEATQKMESESNLEF